MNDDKINETFDFSETLSEDALKTLLLNKRITGISLRADSKIELILDDGQKLNADQPPEWNVFSNFWHSKNDLENLQKVNDLFSETTHPLLLEEIEKVNQFFQQESFSKLSEKQKKKWQSSFKRASLKLKELNYKGLSTVQGHDLETEQDWNNHWSPALTNGILLEKFSKKDLKSIQAALRALEAAKTEKPKKKDILDNLTQYKNLQRNSKFKKIRSKYLGKK